MIDRNPHTPATLIRNPYGPDEPTRTALGRIRRAGFGGWVDLQVEYHNLYHLEEAAYLLRVPVEFLKALTAIGLVPGVELEEGGRVWFGRETTHRMAYPSVQFVRIFDGGDGPRVLTDKGWEPVPIALYSRACAGDHARPEHPDADGFANELCHKYDRGKPAVPKYDMVGAEVP